ncbi:MAG: endopeptidase La [Lewinella sp.]|nr:endopeptidase La [Lewinella sp.]
MFEDLMFPRGFEEETDFLPFISLDDEEENHPNETIPDELPVLALKNTVLFPNIVIPITVGRDKSIQAINRAYETNRLVAVLSQRDMDVEEPQAEDLFRVGAVARILKLLKMPDGTLTAILQGRQRVEISEMLREDPYMVGRFQAREYINPDDPVEFEALVSSIQDLARQIIDLSPNIPSEATVVLRNIKTPNFLLNFIASNINADLEWKQQVLETDDISDKANAILVQLNSELQILELKDQIENKVRVDIEKQQRDYFLNQQLKTIQEELGQNPQEEEVERLEEKSKRKKWPEYVAKAFDKELNRLRRMNPQVAEYSVQMNYLELLIDLPWQETTKDNFDLKRVHQVLDQDHYGLEKVKQRILEHLAVLKLKGDMKAPILCLVGPPGVGKTSLGRSIARALDREFIRMSLGGLHDESEIRGHRKTYIGAMPGRIIQNLRKAGASNPVFILDEIDKVGKDFRGDPSSALLEVLDPEQNGTFHDNYLELEYDLSKVLFVATANSLNTIQPALLDRMEVIDISGYSTEEKVEIAKRHLIPKQRKAHGVTAKQVTLRDPVIKAIIQQYTRESGVRALDRQIAGVMRFVAKSVAMEEQYSPSIKVNDLPAILGPVRFNPERYQQIDVPGVAIGLAWTSVGGEILFVEASLSPGKGKLTLTGNLGDVMKESATTALSFIKAHSESLGIDGQLFDSRDLHLHVPEGAIPKDGPSAGITMLTALTSLFTQRKVKPFLAMTGEITLRGKVLPVGGIKEKILAAKRAGMREIILCQENEKHIAEINPDYIKGMTFHYVDRMEEVLDIALLD